MTELTVLCITGWCRNGSTIIGNILNEVPDFFHVGELHFLWRNSAGEGANNLCGCRAPLTECEIWSKVLAAGRPALYKGTTLPLPSPGEGTKAPLSVSLPAER